MPTRQEIEATYKAAHDALTVSYYRKHAISQADFQAQHTALGQQLLTDLEAIGEYTWPPDPVDLVDKYGKCKTDSDRIGVIAQRLGLVPQI